MNHALLADTGWAALRARLPPDLDLDASARDRGALRRRRGVGGADALLRLALIYGTTPLSLRTTAAWAEVGDLGHLSDVALLDRLRGAEAWLGAVLGALLGAALPASARPAAVTGTRHRRVLLADATALPPPGGRPGIAWRVHASFDLGRRRFDHLELTDGSGGGSEGLHRCPASAGAIVVADRFYAKAAGLHHLAGRGADFVVRRGLTGCTLRRPDGGKLDLAPVFDGLGDGATADVPVRVPRLGAPEVPPLSARLIVHRRPAEAAAEARERARRRARKHGYAAQPKQLRAAEHMMLLTSLDAAHHPAEAVLALYRLRWQVELAFKRLKSLVGLGDLQAKEPRLARACLYAKLILAALSEQLVQGALAAASPSATGPAAAVAMAAASAGRAGAAHGAARRARSRPLGRPAAPRAASPQ